MSDPITHQNIEEAAERAAIRALDLLMLHVGIDVNDPEEVRAMRERFEFLKRMHRGAVEVKGAAIKTCVGALVTGLISALGIGVHSWFTR